MRSDISLKGGIVAGAAGGAVFLLFLLPLDFGIIVSIVAAAGAFAAAYFVARGQNGEEMNIDLGIDRAVYDAVLKDGVRKTTELRKYVSRMKAGDAKENALKICGFADRIVQDVTDDPKDARAASQFMNYYLDTTIKIVKQYLEITGKNVSSDDIDEVIVKVENLFATLETAFEKQLAKLLDDNIMDLDTEITLLEKTIQLDGIFDASEVKKIRKKKTTA